MARRRRVNINEWPKNLPSNPLDWPARETRWIDLDAPSPAPELQYLGILAFPDRLDRAKHFLRCYTALAFKNAIQAGRMDPNGIRVTWWIEGSDNRRPYKDMRRERLLSSINQAFSWIEKRLRALEAFDRRFQLEAFGPGDWLFENPGISLDRRKPGIVRIAFDPVSATLKGGFREKFQHLSKLDKWDSKADKAETAVEHAMTRIWSASKPVLHLAYGLKAMLDKGYDGPALLHLIQCGGWALEAIRVAEFVRTIGFAAFTSGPHGFLHIDRKKTIQVLPKSGFEELLKPD